MFDETNFVNQLKSGDEIAFRTLFLDNKDGIYNTSLHLLQNESDAMDVMQDVFLEVFQSIQTFQGKSALSTWIYRICVNKSLEVIRKRKRFFTFSLIQNQSASKRSKENWVHPGVVLEQKEQARKLYSAIARLKDKEKISFTLFHIQGFSQKEISEITEQSIPAVETQIHRAKQKLAQWLIGEKL